MLRHQLEQNPANTVGLLYGYFGGAVLIAGEWTLIVGGAVIVADDAINFVELDPATGAVSANVDGFDPARIPMAKVATMDGEVASVSDWRPSFIPGAAGINGADGVNGINGVDGAPGAIGEQGPEGPAGVAGPQGEAGPQGPAGESGILHGTGVPEDGVTGLDSSTKLYQNDTPAEGEAVLYLNTDPANPSTNPQWRGVNVINQ